MKKSTILFLIVTLISCSPIPKTEILLGFELGMTKSEYIKHRNSLSFYEKISVNDDGTFIYTHYIDEITVSNQIIKGFGFLAKPSFRKLDGIEYLNGLIITIYGGSGGEKVANVLYDLINSKGYKRENSLFPTMGFKDSFGDYVASWKDNDYHINLSITKAETTNLSLDGDSTPNEIGFLIYFLSVEDTGNESSNQNPF